MIEQIRLQFRTANQKLRRARRLYVYLCRDSINNDGNVVLDFMEKHAHKRGLYADATNERSVRQSIIIHLFRIEIKGGTYARDWHKWLMMKGISPYHGYFKASAERLKA